MSAIVVDSISTRGSECSHFFNLLKRNAALSFAHKMWGKEYVLCITYTVFPLSMKEQTVKLDKKIAKIFYVLKLFLFIILFSLLSF